MTGISPFSKTLSRNFMVCHPRCVCVTNEREGSVVNQHNLFTKMLYSNNETTCFGYNDHRHVSTTIKKCLYICVREC